MVSLGQMFDGDVIVRPDLDIVFGKQITLECFVCQLPYITVHSSQTDAWTKCRNCGNTFHVIKRGNRYGMKVWVNNKLMSLEELQVGG